MTTSTLTAAAENAFRAWLKFCPEKGVRALLVALESPAETKDLGLTYDAFVRDRRGRSLAYNVNADFPVGFCCPASYPVWAADPGLTCGEVWTRVDAMRRTVSPAAFHMHVDREGLWALRADIARVVREHLGLPPARKESP